MRCRLLFVATMFVTVWLLAACYGASSTPAAIETPNRNAIVTEDVARADTLDSADITPEPMSEQYCLVTVPKLNIRSGPSTEFPRLTTIPLNTRVVVTGSDASKTWYYGNALEVDGWASSEFLDCYSDSASLPVISTPVPETVDTPTPQMTFGFDQSTVTLLEPLEQALCGRRTFRWSSSVKAEADQMFELIFWPAGTDPIADGFSPVGAQPSNEVTVDLSATAEYLPMLMNGKDYQWGVLLVHANPYERIRYLGGGHPFRLRSQAECDAERPIPVLTYIPVEKAYPDD